jgi:hypothetical protein
VKKTPYNRIVSASKWVNSNLVEKFLNEPTGNTDPISQEMAEERKHKKRDRESERRAFYTMLEWKKR